MLLNLQGENEHIWSLFVLGLCESGFCLLLILAQSLGMTLHFSFEISLESEYEESTFSIMFVPSPSQQ